MVQAKLAHQRIERHHLGGVIGQHPHRLSRKHRFPKIGDVAAGAALDVDQPLPTMPSGPSPTDRRPSVRVRASPLSHARRPHIASVLVQNHPDDLPALIAFEVELHIDNLIKELVLGAREDLDGGLPCELRFEMIAMDRDIEYGTEIEAVFSNVMSSVAASSAIAWRPGGSSDALSFGAARSPFWCRTSPFTTPLASPVKVMLMPATLAKSSLGADGKIGKTACPVAWAKSPSSRRKALSRNLSASLNVPTYSSSDAPGRSIALYVGARGAFASSVAG
jgi:hypothetical protein